VTARGRKRKNYIEWTECREPGSKRDHSTPGLAKLDKGGRVKEDRSPYDKDSSLKGTNRGVVVARANPSCPKDRVAESNKGHEKGGIGTYKEKRVVLGGDIGGRNEIESPA